jgi:hypothetical protein
MLRGTTAQLESFPRLEIALKSDIFLHYIYLVCFQLTYVT